MMRGVLGLAAMIIFATGASAQGGMSGMSGMAAPTPTPLPNGWYLAQDANGKQVNQLEVRAGADSVRFFANGKAVAAYGSGVATPGIDGFRVGHALDIVVEGFTKK